MAILAGETGAQAFCQARMARGCATPCITWLPTCCTPIFKLQSPARMGAICGASVQLAKGVDPEVLTAEVRAKIQANVEFGLRKQLELLEKEFQEYAKVRIEEAKSQK